jgi:arsenical pump membrane protein
MQYNNSFTAFEKTEWFPPRLTRAASYAPRVESWLRLGTLPSVALVVAVVAIGLVVARPRRVPVWVWPLAAAVLLVATGGVAPRAALASLAAQWNVFAFILGLMLLAAAAQESGAFAWLTQRVLARAGGSRRRLFVWVFGAAAVTTIVLSNDATAIVLTPLVYAAVARRGGDPMPYLFACAFVANTASFGLPFSNPANVLIDGSPQPLHYVAALGPPQVAALGINLAVFGFVFRKSLRGTYSFDPPGAPAPRAVRTLWALAAVVPLYAAALALSWPLGPVATAAGLAVLLVAWTSPAAALRHVGWGTFVLLAALFVLLDAVARAGLVTWAVAHLQDAERYGSLAAVAAACGGAALLSNLLNNLPVAIVASYVAAHDPGGRIAYATIAGVDVGPNLTTAGSLATLLWLTVLDRRGMRVDPLEFFRLGALVVPPVLAVTVAWLWLLR